MAKKKKPPAVPAIRNRIQRHVTIRAGDLVPHELNPRAVHPDAQRAALQGAYEEIGFARSLLAYELPDGRLKLIDGHLRQSMHPDMMVTVEVVDLDDAEARLMLATADPIAAMALADKERTEALLREVSTSNEALGQFLTEQAEKAGVIPELKAEVVPPEEFPAYDEDIPTDYCCPKCGYKWSGGNGRATTDNPE